MGLPILLIEMRTGVGLQEDFVSDALHAAGNKMFPKATMKRVRYFSRESAGADTVLSCIRETNYEYAGIIVCDFTFCHDEFRHLIGPDLQDYVRNGGRLAFIGSDGALPPTLQKLFDVPWTASDNYCRQCMARPVCAQRLDEHFSSTVLPKRAVDMTFCVSAYWLRNVPLQDRCFGAEPEPADNSETGEEGSNCSTEQKPRPRSEDSDACVAVRKFGCGAIAFFGDEACREETACLVFAFCFIGEGQSRELPYQASYHWDLAKRAFRAMMHKVTADHCRKACRAIEKDNSKHALEHSQILTLLAECGLRLENWIMARDAAANAIQLDNANTVALHHHALALARVLKKDVDELNIEHSVPDDDLGYLRSLLLH